MVNVDGATNTATFKIYDASADAELTATLGGASTVLIVPAGTIGSGDSPVTISTSVADDGGGTPVDGGSPFGSPVQHPQIPAVVIAKVYVEGQPASEGDQVGVYVGDVLRGNGAVVKSDGLAYSAITVNVSSSSELAEFKIWDKSATKTYSAYIGGGQTTAVAPGGTVGSWTAPVLLDTKAGDVPTPENRLPVADAGQAETVQAKETVTLDGGGSIDPDGDLLNYNWTPPQGVSLSDANAVSPTFEAPEVTVATTYTFSLVVNDGKAKFEQYIDRNNYGNSVA